MLFLNSVKLALRGLCGTKNPNRQTDKQTKNKNKRRFDLYYSHQKSILMVEVGIQPQDANSAVNITSINKRT